MSEHFEKLKYMMTLLTPYSATKYEKVRIGNDGDGGYVILDIYKTNASDTNNKIQLNAIYGYGVNEDCGFEDEMVTKYDSVGYLYDHTVNPNWKPMNDKLKFKCQGLCSQLPLKTNIFDSLENHLKENNDFGKKNLFLKMDIEGCEIGEFNIYADEMLNVFSQIAMEVHHINSDKSGNVDKKINMFEKLNKNFYLVHVHRNNCSSTFKEYGLCIPSTLELTYVNKNIISDCITKNNQAYPTVLDVQNSKDRPDKNLHFWPFLPTD